MYKCASKLVDLSAESVKQSFCTQKLGIQKGMPVRSQHRLQKTLLQCKICAEKYYGAHTGTFDAAIRSYVPY